MAEATRQGRETVQNFIENEIAENIERYWKGNLEEQQQSLAEDIKIDTEEGLVQVYSDNEVLVFLEFGTDPHTITPDTADALRWFNDDGEAVFAQKVQHPGFEPFSHARNAIDRRRNELQ